jgi:hypothetical protein
MWAHLSNISKGDAENTPHASPPILLLLSGWAGSGKDAAAALLGEEHRFHRFAFADPLKAAVSAATGLHPSRFERPYKDRPINEGGGQTPRDLLIAHADAARAVDRDIYSQAIVTDILQSGYRRVVISDWRYQREGAVVADALAAQGWCIVRARVTRPGVIPSSAPIEHDLDDFPMDWRIENDGSLSDLRVKLTAWAAGL